MKENERNVNRKSPNRDHVPRLSAREAWAHRRFPDRRGVTLSDEANERDGRMLLAGDIGGTETLLGLFDPVPARPHPIAIRSYSTLDFDELTTMIGRFL